MPLSKDREDSLGHRIREVRRARGLTQKEFADSLGIVQGFLSSVERGRKTPSDTLLIALCHSYGVNSEWLRTGKGEMLGGEEGAKRGLPGRGAEGAPLLARISGEFPDSIAQEDIIGHVSLPEVPPGCYGLVTYGDFMAPSIRDGDLVIFKPGGEAANGTIVLVTNRWGEAILRRYRIKDGEVFLSPDNASYSPFRPDPDTRIIGAVVQVWRRVRI